MQGWVNWVHQHFADTPNAKAADRRWRIAALLLGCIAFGIGCNPFTLPFLLRDPYFPPEFDFTKTKRNPKVVILANHARTETRDYFLTADDELAEQLARVLTQRYADRGLRIEIIPSWKVQEYKGKHLSSWKLKSPVEIGKDLGADFVINMEITRISLYEPGSSNMLYKGEAEIDISVYDVNGPEQQGPVHTKNYLCASYPSQGPIPADNRSTHAFRAAFVLRMARDISRIYAPHTTQEKLHLD